MTYAMTACRVCGKRDDKWNGVVEAAASTTLFKPDYRPCTIGIR